LVNLSAIVLFKIIGNFVGKFINRICVDFLIKYDEIFVINQLGMFLICVEEEEKKK